MGIPYSHGEVFYFDAKQDPSSVGDGFVFIPAVAIEQLANVHFSLGSARLAKDKVNQECQYRTYL